LVFNLQHWIVEDWVLLFFFQCDHPCLITRVTSMRSELEWTPVFFFNFFLHLFSFFISSFDFEFLKYWFFYMLFMRMSRPHDPGYYTNLDWVRAFFSFFIFSLPFTLRFITEFTKFYFVLKHVGNALTSFFKFQMVMFLKL
jgi:hypothetical protein